MNGARPFLRPARRRAFKQRTTITHIPALEDHLAPVDGGDDVQYGDFIGRPGEPEAATYAFGGDHQSGLGQFGENLGQVFLGYALQLGQVTHAGFPAVAPLIDQKSQAVDAVLHPSAVQ
ncbi:hypothetical protein D3C80_1797730 [compost metagenome]